MAGLNSSYAMAKHLVAAFNLLLPAQCLKRRIMITKHQELVMPDVVNIHATIVKQFAL
jgi:hypothetical protein